MTATTTEVSAGEVQTIVAARRLRHTKTVFIDVGRPSTAAWVATWSPAVSGSGPLSE